MPKSTVDEKMIREVATRLALGDFVSPAEKEQHRRFKESAKVFRRIRLPKMRLINPLEHK